MMTDRIENHGGYITITRFGDFSLQELVTQALEMDLDPAKIFVGCADGGPSVVTWMVDNGEDEG